MNAKTMTSLALAAIIATGTLAGTAFAANQVEDRETTALTNAKVSLAQAITTAEQKTGGHAYDAGVSTDGGQTRIVVQTNGPGGAQTISVDAQTGQVVANQAGAEQGGEQGEDGQD